MKKQGRRPEAIRVGRVIRETRERKGISQENLADMMGITRAAVSQWENGETLPDRGNAQLLSRLLHISLELLVGVEGQMSLPVRTFREYNDVAFVPEFDLRQVSGRGGSDIEVLESAADEARIGTFGFPKPGFRHVYGATPDNVVILEVVGDSMAPTLIPGQKVMVDIRDRSPTPPGIFVVWDGAGMVLKRVQYLAHSDPPRVRITSDNPHYEPYERLADEAYIQGRVIGAWGRL